jgi:hypothetical protein
MSRGCRIVKILFSDVERYRAVNTSEDPGPVVVIGVQFGPEFADRADLADTVLRYPKDAIPR